MRTLEARIVDSTHLELVEPIAARPGSLIAISVQEEKPTQGPPEVVTETLSRSPKESEPKTLSGPQRARERAWCRSHRDDLRQYAGQWVILEGEEIIAHGGNPGQLVKQARARGVGVPYIFYVGESDPDVFRMGL